VDARRAFFPRMLTLGAHPLARVAVSSPTLAIRINHRDGRSEYPVRQRNRPNASFSHHGLSSEASQPGSVESIASRSHGCPDLAVRCPQIDSIGHCPQGRLRAERLAADIADVDLVLRVLPLASQVVSHFAVLHCRGNDSCFMFPFPTDDHRQVDHGQSSPARAAWQQPFAIWTKSGWFTVTTVASQPLCRPDRFGRSFRPVSPDNSHSQTDETCSAGAPRCLPF
jgi:hypothetical protein